MVKRFKRGLQERKGCEYNTKEEPKPLTKKPVRKYRGSRWDYCLAEDAKAYEEKEEEILRFRFAIKVESNVSRYEAKVPWGDLKAQLKIDDEFRLWGHLGSSILDKKPDIIPPLTIQICNHNYGGLSSNQITDRDIAADHCQPISHMTEHQVAEMTDKTIANVTLEQNENLLNMTSTNEKSYTILEKYMGELTNTDINQTEEVNLRKTKQNQAYIQAFIEQNLLKTNIANSDQTENKLDHTEDKIGLKPIISEVNASNMTKKQKGNSSIGEISSSCEKMALNLSTTHENDNSYD